MTTSPPPPQQNSTISHAIPPTTTTTNLQFKQRELPESLKNLGHEPLEKKLAALLRHHHNSITIHSRIVKNASALEQKTLSIGHSIASSLRSTASVHEEWTSKTQQVKELWQKVAEVNDREVQLKEQDEALVSEMAVLKKLIDHGMESSADDVAILMKRLHTEKERLARITSDEKTQIVSLLSDVNAYTMKLRKLESQREELYQYNDYLADTIAGIKNEIQEYVLEKKKVEQSLVAIKRGLDERNSQYEDEQQNYRMNEEEIVHQSQMLNEETAKADRASKNVQASNLKLQKVKNTLAKQTYENTLMQSRHDILTEEIAQAEQEKNRLKDQLNEMDRRKQQYRNARHQLEKLSAQHEQQRQQLNRDIKLLKSELDTAKRESEVQELKIKDLEHQHRVMDKNLTRNENEFERQRSIMRLYDNEKKNMEQKILVFRNRQEDQRRALYRVEREMENYSKLDEEAKQQVFRAHEEYVRAQQHSEKLSQRIEQGKERQKRNEALRDAVREERDIYNKNCQKTKDQIDETQKRFKHYLQAISQLKEEITTMDKRLFKKQEVITKIKKEEGKCADRVTQIKERIKEANQKYESLTAQIEELHAVIRASEKEKKDRKKELESVVHDRDILGRRLIERNDELAALYEKIKLQQSLLNKNSVQFRNKVQEIELIQSKIGDLNNTQDQLDPEIAQMHSLKTEVSSLRQVLLHEKMKLRSLSDELSRPMNVHRWRSLKSTNPKAFEKLKKIQKMQHALVRLNGQVADQDLEIQSREKLYKELQDNMQKQPGPEVVEQVAAYQSTYKKKKRQLKEAQGELKKYRNTVSEQKEQVQSIMQQLEDMRKQFFKMRDREQQSWGAGLVDDEWAEYRGGGGGFEFAEYGEDDDQHEAGNTELSLSAIDSAAAKFPVKQNSRKSQSASRDSLPPIRESSRGS